MTDPPGSFHLPHQRCTINWLHCQEKKHFHLCLSLSSEESTVFQVVLDDDICDSVKNKLHILGVCGAGEVGVNLLGVLPLVQVLKLTLNVRSCFLVRVGASVFWVADGKRTFLDLLLKQVLLIEEEDDGSVCEPLIVADAVE